MKTLIAVGRLNNEQLTLEIDSMFPPSAEWLAANNAVIQPSETNGWLLPGTECVCDVDCRCGNHDLDAEAGYFARQYRATYRATDESDAYEPGDPKGFVL